MADFFCSTTTADWKFLLPQAVYGMNIVENSNARWSLRSFAIVATVLTVVTLMLALFRLRAVKASLVKACLQQRTHRKRAACVEPEDGGQIP